MFPTPTLFPTPNATPAIHIPDVNADIAYGAVQMWHQFGDFTTIIQIGVIMMIVLGGLVFLMNALKEI